MQLFNVFLNHLPQVHKRATECINAHNILQKIHSGDCPKNLLSDNSILQQLKVFLVCLYVYFIVYMFVGYLVILILFLINKYSILFVWCDSLSQKCVQILIFWPQEGSLHLSVTFIPVYPLIGRTPPLLLITWRILWMILQMALKKLELYFWLSFQLVCSFVFVWSWRVQKIVIVVVFALFFVKGI